MSAPHASYLSGNLFDLGPQVLFDDAEGGVVYRPGVVDPDTTQRWFEALRDGIAWQAYQRPMYDRIVDVPRRVASYWLDAQDLPAALVEAATLIRAELGVPFNAVIRAKRPPRHVRHVELEPGSLLLMSHASQHHYDHGVPKTRDPVGPRISLAFRVRPAPDSAG